MVDPSLHQSFCDKFIRTMPLKILTSKDKPAIFDWERVLDTYPYPPHDKAGVENYICHILTKMFKRNRCVAVGI